MNPITDRLWGPREDSFFIVTLFLFCAFVLFFQLGGAALFEPTEGRNAEIAREILVSHDWVTPHDDFIPVLDKPIFFHWTVAICYKLFGVSEASARLPAALAGLGAVVLVFLFARNFLGIWPALWSSLILTTSLEFFALSRIVLLDMPLTFFVTLSLCCFYWGLNSLQMSRKRLLYLAMYAAMGVATLIKGPIGAVLPGMVILLYISALKKWHFLRELELFPGLVLFLVIVAPWYLLVEMRNPGYLRYFLWEENFTRFLTPHFGRTEPIYYFVEVLAVGFLPWTLLIPYMVKFEKKTIRNETSLFLMFWTILPFLFFSFSHTKLSHYILPIYPPLAVLAGAAVARSLKESSSHKKWPLCLPAFNLLLLLILLTVGLAWPEILPPPLKGALGKTLHEFPAIFIFGALLAAIWFGLAMWKRIANNQGPLFLLCCAGFAIYFFTANIIVRQIAIDSSSKALAQKSAPFIKAEDQIVLYDFRSSLPYYLKIQRPMWIVWPGVGDSVMESFYIVEKHPQPPPAYGKALVTPAEFGRLKEAAQRNLLIFIKKRNLRRLVGKNLSSAKVILEFDDWALVLIPRSAGNRSPYPGLV